MSLGDQGGAGDGLLGVFETERPRLVGLAYRMLGSASDAEDIVQEAYLRWVDRPRDDVDNPAAYLTTVVSRLAIDRLRSAQHQRETYVGPWLPEPVLVESGPEQAAELAESLTVSFLTVLERLGPVERAVFLLHDIFSLPFAEIASIVERTETNCRQIASRARSHVADERARFSPDPGAQHRLLDAFLAAATSGDLAGLESLLSDDVVHLSDGGADRRAARQPVVGRERVARLIVNLTARLLEVGDALEVIRLGVNQGPGVLIRVGGVPEIVLTVEGDDRTIHRIYAVLNPEKLARLDGVEPETGLR